MSNDLDLKPCPFCGAAPEVKQEFSYVRVLCSNKECITLLASQSLIQNKAFKRWTTRAPISSGCFDKKGREVKDGDFVRVHYLTDDNDSAWETLPVFYADGAFWVDDSLKQDRSSRSPLHEYSEYEVVTCNKLIKEKVKIFRQTDAGAYTPAWIHALNRSGYAGINKAGHIVDRREFKEAIPVPANSKFGVPKPKKL